MDTSGLSLVAYFGAWVTVSAGIWFIFEKTEEAVTPEVREGPPGLVEALEPQRGCSGLAGPGPCGL